MVKKRFLLFIVFFSGIFLNAASAQESIIPDLSDSFVDKLVNAALQYYPKVKSFQDRVDIANTTISRTKISVLDAVTVSYVYQPNTTTIDPNNPSTSYFRGFQTGVFLNVGTLLAKPSQVKQAKQELSVANHEQQDYIITITTEVKKRYYLYVQRLAELSLQNKSVQDVEGALKDVKYRFEKGEETFENYNKVQSDLNNHRLSKIQAESNLFIARADLEELLGTKLENVK